jgi:DNA helicase-2/ATP-dependent DNA helicase PcrA
MNESTILSPLNEKQREAVGAPMQNLLVLAGAGSGKTRVLVHRMAWLMQVEGVSPFSILSVTFTNKAANEMRERIESMLQMPLGSMWVGTFHGLAHRLLRLHWQDAKLPQSFQILDAEDQNRLLRRIHKNLDLDEGKWPPKQSQWFINSKKEEGLRPQHIKAQGHFFAETMLRVYQAYEEACQASGLVDFAELLLRSYELLCQQTDVLQHYQQRFQHILVDEFQDTNTLQYAWLKLLAGKQSCIMVVGDDDQSIYSWRGARIENIQRFSQDFTNTLTVRLEQNYRSTGTILAAANALIANNDNRMGKNLWTSGTTGDAISVYSAFNEYDEARFIVDRIRDWVYSGKPRLEVAILYRSNAQSRVLEEQLMQAAIPYRVYGGLRFFERAEIKDALGYLRLIANRDNDTAFERIINTPTRGIGNTTLTTLRETAKMETISLWQTAKKLLDEQHLTNRAAQVLQAFINLIDELAIASDLMQLGDLTEHVLKESGLMDFYRQEKSEKALSRVENLEELINATRQFTSKEDDAKLSPLSAFLSHAALEAGENQAEPFTDYVQLMTLHSAKGLEFPLVFMSGLEEGLFPHQMSMQEPGQIEEERRLCYVGMTRAMRKLYLTHAENRRIHGHETYCRPSRFINEVPAKFLQPIRMQTKVSHPMSMSTSLPKAPIKIAFDTGMGFTLGQRVRHQKFGEGVVLNYEGQGTQARVQVRFNKVGTKWLALGLANLQAA